MAETPFITGIRDLYKLGIKFNDIDTVFSIDSIYDLTISSSLISFLPTVRLKIKCDSGYITHNLPFDRATKLSIMFQAYEDIDNYYNYYEFDIYDRQPVQDLIFECEGLLSCPNVFAPRHCRGWKDTISNVVMDVAEDMGFNLNSKSNDVFISNTFNNTEQKAIVQPYINNLGFLNWLCQNVKDQKNGGLFFSFVDNTKGVPKFYFKSLYDFCKDPIKYQFILGNGSAELARIPVYEYKIIDNYKCIGLYGLNKKDYVYFDYTLGKFKRKEVDLQGFKSLTPLFMFTNADTKATYNDVVTGRSNDFTSDFTEKSTNDLYINVINLSRLQISTQGLVNIHPGDLIDIIFGSASLEDNINRQYNGVWLVEKIDHNFGRIYSNTLTLTRSGLERVSDGNSSLLNTKSILDSEYTKNPLYK